MDEWEIFYYDERNDRVCSIAKYHFENCSIEPLVEAHPDVIYFYASITPYKDWDFNEVAVLPLEEMDPAAAIIVSGLPVPEHMLFGNRKFKWGIEPVHHCIGVKGCKASHHANDCPVWGE